LQAGIRETGGVPGFIPGHEWARLIIKYCTKPPFIDRENPGSKPERRVREARGTPGRGCGASLMVIQEVSHFKGSAKRWIVTIVLVR